MIDLNAIGLKARNASYIIGNLGVAKKDEALKAVARELVENTEDIIKANAIDLENAITNGMKESLIDRLSLNKERIESMADGLIKLTLLEDPIGEILYMKERPNGLMIGQKRVPLGVIGIIYESRPNVTADAFGLCFKSGNVVILRGGSDAINSNLKIVEVIKNALKKIDICEDVIQLLEDTSRDTAKELMRLNKYIDLLIPRGGAGLIKTVIENSTIPVIETGTGNCHIFVDESADLNMALDIIHNSKTQRLGVCNALESLVLHDKISKEFLPLLAKKLDNVELRGDEKVKAILNEITLATEEDFYEEYLDLILSIKVVSNIDEAIEHINKYSTKHSEAIITSDYNNSQKFLNRIDSAAVYVNASTRFTDGYEFGFGAEIGISTQKLHARGPMGLKELTTTKYIIYGNGQIRG